MDGCGAHLCCFMLAFESGHQFPSLLGLLKENVFQVCRLTLVVRTQVENLVGLGGRHRIHLELDALVASHISPKRGPHALGRAVCTPYPPVGAPHTLGFPPLDAGISSRDPLGPSG
jgi:hypothetical protein